MKMLWVVLLALLIPFFATAQELQIPQSIDLSIEPIPLTPAPGQSVTLQAKSFSVDVHQHTLTWTYGGKQVASGFGKSRISVTAPGAGGVGIVSVTLSGNGIDPVQASLSIRPASVDLLLEAVDSTVPAFYKGRTLPAAGGKYRITALPALGASTARSNFQWSRNNSSLQAGSGTGRSSITLTHNGLSPQETVAVEVAGGSFQGSGVLDIIPSDPTAVAYENKGGFIDYARGMADTIAFTSEGMSIRFEPYFFSLPQGEDYLQFSFSIGNEPVYGETTTNELVLSRPPNEGTAPLTLSITPREYSLQNLRKQFLLSF